MKKGLRSLLLICFFPALTYAQNGTETVKVTDMTLIKQVSGVAFSHDGKKIVYTVTAIVPDEENKTEYLYRSQLWLASASGSFEPRQLTSALASSSQAVWSKNDETLAFVRAVKGKPQVFLLNMNGGEPVQLTESAYGATGPQWSPDGKKILYSASLSLAEMVKDSVLNIGQKMPAWTLERPGFKANPKPTKTKADANGNVDAIRNYLVQDEVEKRVKVFNKLNFEGEAATNPEFSFNQYYLIDATPGARASAFTTGYYSYGAAQFTPDGKSAILTASLDSLQHPDRVRSSEVYSVPVGGGRPQLLISESGITTTNGPVSPSGRYMAYTTSPGTGINIPQLMLYDFQHPADRFVIPVDRSITGMVWSADSKYLYFTAQSNGGAPVYRVSMNNLKVVERLADFDAGLTSLDVSKSQLVYAKTEVSSPLELYVSDLANKVPKRVTDLNTGWIKNKKLSFPEKKYYTDSKGLKVEYWVMKPIGFDSTKKYPMMLQIHGGPTAMWGPGEASMWHEFQYFCGQGYGVVYSNPRGSGGYGIEFLRANYQDWGAGPTEDALAALDGAVAEGWADKSKLVVSGGSYAGYLTAWIIAHDSRFAAASSQRGVYDLATFFGEGNAWSLVPNYFGGYPWDEKTKPILQRESPFTYVNQIHTPYLILHGETDLRTGIVQGEMMYKALKVLHRDVEYVQHPGATHELVRSGNVKQRIDQMLRIYEFFERYIIH